MNWIHWKGFSNFLKGFSNFRNLYMNIFSFAFEELA